MKRPELSNAPVSFLSGVLAVKTTPLGKDTGVFESFGRFIIVLLDESVTTTPYVCALPMNNPICRNLRTLHCHHNRYEEFFSNVLQQEISYFLKSVLPILSCMSSGT